MVYLPLSFQSPTLRLAVSLVPMEAVDIWATPACNFAVQTQVRVTLSLVALAGRV